MSDAMYIAVRNFSNMYRAASGTHYNPLRFVRKRVEKLACDAQRDQPRADIYRHSIPRHLMQVAGVGPRMGAKAASYTVGTLHGLVAGIKDALTPSQNVVECPPLTKRTRAWEEAVGVVGTLFGALLGLTVKSAEHVVIAGAYLGAMLAGALVGLTVGLPVTVAYASAIGMSHKLRVDLRQKRKNLNLAALLTMKQKPRAATRSDASSDSGFGSDRAEDVVVSDSAPVDLAAETDDPAARAQKKLRRLRVA